MSSELVKYENAVDNLIAAYQASHSQIMDFNAVHLDLMKNLNNQSTAIQDAVDPSVVSDFNDRKKGLRQMQGAFRLDVKLAEGCKRQRMGVGLDGQLAQGASRDFSESQALVENIATASARKRRRDLDTLAAPFVPLLHAATRQRTAAGKNLSSIESLQCSGFDNHAVTFVTTEGFRYELLRRLENNVRDVISA